MQGDHRRQRRPRRADLDAGTMDRVELPGGDHRDNTRRQLDVRDLARSALLRQNATHTSATERVPRIVDDDFLPDMGTMTARL
jgi:hypothetical protein